MKKLLILFMLLLFISPVYADTIFFYQDVQPIGRYNLDVFYTNQTLITSLTGGENITIVDNSSIYLTIRPNRFDPLANPVLFFDWIFDYVYYFFGFVMLLIMGSFFWWFMKQVMKK